MFLSLCIFVFRHSTIRTFFLSILAAILIAILSGVVMALFNFRESAILLTMIVYFIFFLVFAITTIGRKVRSVFTGIALNLAVILTPFFPLMCVGTYYEHYEHRYYDYDYYAYGVYDPYYVPIDRSQELLHYQLAEIFGFVILLILIETAYKWMFRKWYASPEE